MTKEIEYVQFRVGMTSDFVVAELLDASATTLQVRNPVLIGMIITENDEDGEGGGEHVMVAREYMPFTRDGVVNIMNNGVNAVCKPSQAIIQYFILYNQKQQGVYENNLRDMMQRLNDETKTEELAPAIEAKQTSFFVELFGKIHSH